MQRRHWWAFTYPSPLPPLPSSSFPPSSPFVRWDMKGRRIYSALTGGGERERKVGSVGGNICGRRLSNIFFYSREEGRGKEMGWAVEKRKSNEDHALIFPFCFHSFL